MNVDCNSSTVLSLCTGAGGLDLGLKLAMPQARTVCYVEGEAYAAAQLAARMEDKTLDAAPVWSDVKTFDPEPWRGCVDIITAGYPCQPFSIAGAKLGEKDPRHLWPFIREIVRVIEPKICFFENVAHHLRLGFEQVHDDLREMGFGVETGLFTAEEIGAPHRRERLFILAHRDSNRCIGEQSTRTGKDDPEGRAQCSENSVTGGNGDAAKRLSVHKTGSAASSIRQKLQNGKSQLADAQSARAGIDQRNARERLSGDGKELVDTASKRKRREAGDVSETHERPDGQGPQFASGTSKSVADTDGKRLERQPGDEYQRKGADFITEYGLSVWPPGPGEFDAWGSVPDTLKPAVHRMADGMAYRVDRLRACGNGVVPVVAAYAFTVLKGNISL